MRRVINLRTMLIVAVSETVIVFLSCLTDASLLAGLICRAVYYALLFTAALLCFKKAATKWGITLLLCLLLGSLTSISFTVQDLRYTQLDPQSDITYTVQGTVDAVLVDGNTEMGVLLKDVYIDNRAVHGKTQVSFEEDNVYTDMLTVGDVLTLHGRLSAVDLVQDGTVDDTAYRYDIRYYAFAAFSECEILPTKAGPFGRIRNAVYKKLRSACGDTYGSIAYCMLTGDKGQIDDTTSHIYTMGGIGHILAVSGLHVGLIASVLGFLLRKLRIPRLLRVVILLCVLGIYALFIGMTASVVRAVIMCAVAQFTFVNGQRRDSLSALCLAYTAFLLFRPFLLFEVGFQLSFGAVFGLILFSPTFTKYLRKVRFPKWMASTLSAAVAVHLGILPVSAYHFGILQTYSVLYNIVLIPLLSVMYVFFVFATPLSMMFGMDAVLRFGGMGYAICDTVVGTALYLPLHTVLVCAHVGLFALYPIYFAASRYFMQSKLKKTTSLLLLGVCIAIVTVPTLATLQTDTHIKYSVIPVNGSADVTSVIIEDDSVTVIGDVKSISALRKTLVNYRIRKIDTIVLHKLTAQNGAALADFVCDYAVEKIVCPVLTVETEGLAALGTYKHFYTLEDVDMPQVTPIASNNGRHVAFLYKFDESILLFTVGYSASYTDFPVEVMDNAPIVRCFMYLNAMPDRIYLTNMPSGYLGKVPSYQYSLADLGSYMFKIRTGEVIYKK